MKLLLFCIVAAICIVGINCFSLGLDNHESRGMFHEATADTVCASATFLQQAGWLNSDGTQSRQLMESEAAKECRELVGDNSCDTSDRILSCLHNKGLATAINVLTFPARAVSPF